MKIDVRTVSGAAAIGRKARKPRHNFVVKATPYEIRPFFMAPVLAGESMKNLHMQAEVQSGYVRSQVGGWWAEHMFFYVKHTDLSSVISSGPNAGKTSAQVLVDMHVKGTPLVGDHAAPFYGPGFYDQTTADGLHFGYLALERIVEEYFRHEGETYGTATNAANLPLASYMRQDAFDSMSLDSAAAVVDGERLPDAQVLQDKEETLSPLPGFEAHYAQFQRLTAAGYIAVDFEDYLKAHGISVPKEDERPDRPELIRHIKAWAKPSRRVHPETYEPVASLKWEVSESATKDRLFREPGWLVGVQVVRPKVFLNQKFALSSQMRHAWDWLPQLLLDRPETSLRAFTAAQAAAMFPGYTGDDGVWVDMRDLFMWGEQFVGGLSIADLAKVVTVADAPSGVGLSQRYPTPGELAGLMWSTEVPGYETKPSPFDGGFLSEGVVALDILSRVRDLTPGGQMAGANDNG